MYQILLDSVLEKAKKFNETGIAEEMPIDGLNDAVYAVGQHFAAVLRSNFNYALSAMLTVLGDCLGKNVKATHEAYSNKANLYMMLCGDSGDHKSPTINLVTEPMKKIDQKLTEEFEKEYKIAVEKDKNILPENQKQMVAENCTIERLYAILQATKNNIQTGVLLHLDEATYFFKPGASPSNKNGELVPHIITMFAAPYLKVDRVYLGGKSLFIPDPMLSILTGTQYDNLGGIFNAFRGSGFSSRFLFALPSESVPREPLNQLKFDYWRDCIERAISMNELQLRFANGRQIEDIENAFEEAKNDFSKYDKEVGAYVIKQNYYVYRIAIILHCLNSLMMGNEPSAIISEEEVEHAFAICLHYIANAVSAFKIMTSQNAIKLSGKDILKLFDSKWKITNFSALAEATGGKLDRAYASKCVHYKI